MFTEMSLKRPSKSHGEGQKWIQHHLHLHVQNKFAEPNQDVHIYCHPDNQLIGCIAPAATTRESYVSLFLGEQYNWRPHMCPILKEGAREGLRTCCCLESSCTEKENSGNSSVKDRKQKPMKKGPQDYRGRDGFCVNIAIVGKCEENEQYIEKKVMRKLFYRTILGTVLAVVFSTEVFIKISTALTVISYKLFFWMGAQCYDLGEMENDIADENKTGETEKKDKKDKKGEEKIDGNVESKFQLPYFQRLDSNYNSASMLWLLLQFLLWGMMKGILEEGLEEFLHDHIDNDLQVQAVCGIVDTIGNFLKRHGLENRERRDEFKVPKTLALCINNCGLTSNLATNNMCQKCFNATTATTSSSPSSTANITTAGAVAVGPSVLTFSGEQSSRSAKTHLCNQKKKIESMGYE
ncbi:hypothetical protein SLEP1_g59491 [Rubroshorea leprosula]|uniref:A20-type domain-containing protein n=1 Tax=Rubroshorea leprosula TaxID=152421 RepID=A0AAV5MSI2_9ROSI|nr:hypothetical protein SLEP1_g59491 [Rubroshorea leprosula]